MNPEVTTSELDAGRAARAARRERPDWSLERSIGAVDRLLAAVVGHVDDGVGGLAELYALAELQSRVAVAVDTVARNLLEGDDFSYRQIGTALGITRQAAELRYRGSSSRAAGGQPGNLR